MSSMNFKDVEEALEKFSRSPEQRCNEWFVEFEELAETCNWSDIQKYFYTRRLLDGAAKKDVRQKKNIQTYQLLKAYLQEEYKDNTSFVDIHRMLVNRRKKDNESYVKYMFDMLSIGRDKLDDTSMIRAVADGLNVDKSTKMSFYEAKTVKELKDKMIVFEAMQKSKAKPTMSNGHRKNYQRKQNNLHLNS